MSQIRKSVERSQIQSDIVTRETILFWKFDPSLREIEDIGEINLREIDNNILEYVEFILKLRPINLESPCLNSRHKMYPLNDKVYVDRILDEVTNYLEDIKCEVIIYPNKTTQLTNITACRVVIKALEKELSIRA